MEHECTIKPPNQILPAKVTKINIPQIFKELWDNGSQKKRGSKK